MRRNTERGRADHAPLEVNAGQPIATSGEQASRDRELEHRVVARGAELHHEQNADRTEHQTDGLARIERIAQPKRREQHPEERRGRVQDRAIAGRQMQGGECEAQKRHRAVEDADDGVMTPPARELRIEADRREIRERYHARDQHPQAGGGECAEHRGIAYGLVAPIWEMCRTLGEVLTGTDPDLKEGYRNYTKPQVRKLLEFYTKIVSDAEQYSANAKKARKINRKPRVVSVEKVVKNLKFKKTDQEYKLISIEPAQIMAAQELWTFNTRNRMLTVYRAQDAGGLGVKNVKITGYSESTSTSKRLRKPEEVLQKVLTGGKPTLRTLMDEIKTKPVGFSSRIVADTILLRVIK